MKKLAVAVAIVGTLVVIFFAAPLLAPQRENLCGREKMKVGYIEVAIAGFRERHGRNPNQGADWNELMRIVPVTDTHAASITKPAANIDAWGSEYQYFDLGDGVFAVTSRGIAENCDFKLTKKEK